MKDIVLTFDIDWAPDFVIDEIMDILNNPSKYSKAVYQSAIRSFGTIQRKTYANKGKLIRRKK